MAGIRTALLAATAATIALAAAPGAYAVSTCSYDAGTHTVTAGTTASGDSVTLVRKPSDTEIQWRTGPGAAVNCGAATMNNTDTVNFTDTSGVSVAFNIDLSEGPFAPGFTDESLPL